MPNSATHYTLPSAYQTGLSCPSVIRGLVADLKQVLHYSEAADERKLVESALDVAEKILNHINETIREQEGRERLRMISNNLWIGEG